MNTVIDIKPSRKELIRSLEVLQERICPNDTHDYVATEIVFLRGKTIAKCQCSRCGKVRYREI